MRRRIPAAALGLLISLVVAACQDRSTVSPTVQAPDVGATVLDAANGGNPHFFFLPPVVASPQANGSFNPMLAPTVEICQTTSLATNGHCTALLASFTTAGGVNNKNLRVDVSVAGEHYQLNWDTKLYAIPLDQPFRVVVLLGNLQLGFLDLVARKGGEYQNASTGTAIKLTAGRTLPLRFRIESGVVCGGALECFEGRVGPEGGTFTVAGPDGTRPAGTSFPPGALEDTVNLFIQRVTGGACLPTDLQQYEGCYRFSTEPVVANFLLPATVGVCLLDPAGLAYLEDHQLRLWKWSEEAGDPLQELERVQIQYLICPELTQTIGANMQFPLLRGIARAGSLLMKPLATLFGPQPAYAMAGGSEGGKLSNFSIISFVRPLNVEIIQGNGQTGFTSWPLPINPTVRVINRYGDTTEGVTGWRVDFTPSGDGTANPPFTLSDAAGQAFTIWTLSSQPGVNTLLAHVPTSRVIAPAPYEVQVSFTANGVTIPTADWLPPLQPSSATGILATSYQPVVVISEVGGAELARLTASFSDTHYQAQWNVPTLDPTRIYRIAIQLFGIQIGYVDLQAVDNELRNVSTGEKVLNLDNSRNLPVKFRLLQ